MLDSIKLMLCAAAFGLAGAAIAAEPIPNEQALGIFNPETLKNTQYEPLRKNDAIEPNKPTIYGVYTKDCIIDMNTMSHLGYMREKYGGTPSGLQTVLVIQTDDPSNSKVREEISAKLDRAGAKNAKVILVKELPDTIPGGPFTMITDQKNTVIWKAGKNDFEEDRKTAKDVAAQGHTFYLKGQKSAEMELLAYKKIYMDPADSEAKQKMEQLHAKASAKDRSEDAKVRATSISQKERRFDFSEDWSLDPKAPKDPKTPNRAADAEDEDRKKLPDFRAKAGCASSNAFDSGFDEALQGQTYVIGAPMGIRKNKNSSVYPTSPERRGCAKFRDTPNEHCCIEGFKSALPILLKRISQKAASKDSDRNNMCERNFARGMRHAKRFCEDECYKERSGVIRYLGCYHLGFLTYTQSKNGCPNNIVLEHNKISRQSIYNEAVGDAGKIESTVLDPNFLTPRAQPVIPKENH